MKRLLSFTVATILLVVLAGCNGVRPLDSCVSTPATTTIKETTATTTQTAEKPAPTETNPSASSTTVTSSTVVPSTTGNIPTTEAPTTSIKPTTTTETATTTTTKLTTTTPSPTLSDKPLGQGGVLRVGDVMGDFRTTNTDGKTVMLSQLLREKKVVILNFWFTTCTFCIREFPAMDTAYQAYKDKAELLAIDPYDSTAEIKAFRAKQNLSFPMAACPISWAEAFRVQGYPTTVVIDRDGVVCMIHTGAMTDTAVWERILEHFTADDYRTTLLKNGVSDLLQ